MTSPNIVLIMADQLAHSVIGALGHPVAVTPNLDRLVETGTSFTNAYCNSPLCAPSRASFATGRLPASIGVFDNGSELPASAPTLYHHLQRAGYETTLSGKMHFIGPDQHHGFEHRLVRDIHTAGFDLTPDWSRGAYENPGTGVRRLENAGPVSWNTQLAYDERVHARALEKIREAGRSRADGRAPFFLCVSYMHPHDPFEITPPYWDLYDGVEVPMPTVRDMSAGETHPFNQWIQIHHELDGNPLSDETICANRRAYLGMVSYLDNKIGELVSELDRMDVLDNTIVIVTSDHGEMLGEHGMWFKRTFYEEAVRIPMIVWGPPLIPANVRRQEVVSLVDLTATISELASTPTHRGSVDTIDGDSFLPLLYGEGHGWNRWKNEAVFEYCGEGTVRPMVGLRRGAHKLVAVAGEQSLLFDLQNDPTEETNLISDPAHAEIARELAARLSEYDLEALERRVLRSQQERLLILDAERHGKRPEWRPPVTGLSRDW